jgi:hypothetical protein
MPSSLGIPIIPVPDYNIFDSDRHPLGPQNPRNDPVSTSLFGFLDQATGNWPGPRSVGAVRGSGNLRFHAEPFDSTEAIYPAKMHRLLRSFLVAPSALAISANAAGFHILAGQCIEHELSKCSSISSDASQDHHLLPPISDDDVPSLEKRQKKGGNKPPE